MKAYLGLGSNLGQRLEQLQRAVESLQAEGLRICRSSSVYESPPWGYTEQPSFLNAVIEIESELEPAALLAVCRQTERELGRIPRPRWQAREIDIDILLIEELVVREPELTVPHPHLHERDFALIPLLEIAPDLTDPTNGERLADCLPAKGALKMYHTGKLAC